MSPSEDGDCSYCQERLTDNDSEVDPFGPDSKSDRQKIGERDLYHPECYEIQYGGRSGITGSVEGLHHDHSICKKDVPKAQESQALGTMKKNLNIVGKDSDNVASQEEIDHGDETQEQHIVLSR